MLHCLIDGYRSEVMEKEKTYKTLAYQIKIAYYVKCVHQLSRLSMYYEYIVQNVNWSMKMQKTMERKKKREANKGTLFCYFVIKMEMFM